MEKIEEENRKLKEAIYKVNSLGLYSQNYWLSQLAYAIERGNLDDFLKDIFDGDNAGSTSELVDHQCDVFFLFHEKAQ